MKRWVILVIAATLVSAVWYFSGVSFRLASAIENEQWLRQVVTARPLASISVGSLAYVATSLIPGTTGKSIVFGWLFGFWIGLAIVSLSLTTAAIIAMLVIRYFFRDWAVSRVPRLAAKIEAALRRGGEATCLMALRLVHAPYTGVNYSAGATDVRATTFAWTTLVGMLPSNLVFVLAGSRLPSLGRMDELDPWAIVDWQLLLISTLVIATPLILSKVAARSAGFNEDNRPRSVRRPSRPDEGGVS